MQTIGTCLPTAASMKRGDRHAASVDAAQRAYGAAMLRDCEKRVVCGETRYYKSASKYAVVSRAMAVKWFEVRADGDYPVR